MRRSAGYASKPISNSSKAQVTTSSRSSQVVAAAMVSRCTPSAHARSMRPGSPASWCTSRLRRVRSPARLSMRGTHSGSTSVRTSSACSRLCRLASLMHGARSPSRGGRRKDEQLARRGRLGEVAVAQQVNARRGGPGGSSRRGGKVLAQQHGERAGGLCAVRHHHLYILRSGHTFAFHSRSSRAFVLHHQLEQRSPAPRARIRRRASGACTPSSARACGWCAERRCARRTPRGDMPRSAADSDPPKGSST